MGKPFTEEHRRKISESCKRTMNTPSVKQARSKSQKLAWAVPTRREKTSGNKNGQWKEDAKYHARHHRIYRKFGKPTTCEECSREGLVRGKIHWANLSGEYLNTREDWKRMCVPCHKKHDLNKLKIKQ